MRTLEPMLQKQVRMPTQIPDSCRYQHITSSRLTRFLPVDVSRTPRGVMLLALPPHLRTSRSEVCLLAVNPRRLVPYRLDILDI